MANYFAIITTNVDTRVRRMNVRRGRVASLTEWVVPHFEGPTVRIRHDLNAFGVNREAVVRRKGTVDEFAMWQFDFDQRRAFDCPIANRWAEVLDYERNGPVAERAVGIIQAFNEQGA